jgi:hypothetical protein
MPNRPPHPTPFQQVTERMFYQLDDYFTNKGYELLHTAGFLTIGGEPDWFEDEEDDEEGDDDSDDEYDSDEEDGDTYDVVRGSSSRRMGWVGTDWWWCRRSLDRSMDRMNHSVSLFSGF